MKASIYIEQGVVQVCLTPEDEWEKNALKMIQKANKVQTYDGGFYKCQGGWYRQCGPSEGKREDSLMFLIEKEKAEQEMNI